jgi:DNA-binding CsgD family transcriptional regulator
MLVRAEWRVDPSAAARRVFNMVAPERAGSLTGRQVVMAVNCLFWFGRASDAVAMLERLCVSMDALDAETVAELRNIHVWISYLYPSFSEHGRGDRVLPSGQDFLPSLSDVRVDASIALASAVVADMRDDAVARAEQVLRRSRLDETTLLPIMAALAALVQVDELERAAFWCDSFGEAAASRARTWDGLLSTVRAIVAVRRGDLPLGLRSARAALGRISPKSWGVAVGLPLAAAVLAATAMAQFEDAVNQLSVPVPEAMFQTPFGLLYLHARGRYYLAVGCFDAALSDFHTCGDLMMKWQLDLPSFVPWRSDAAQAYLGLNMHGEARELATEQMAMLGPGLARTRGITLRVLAATSPLRERPQLLREAAEELRRGGDQLELAYTLGDLAKAHHDRGELSQARMTSHRAYHLAEQCGAELLRRGLFLDAVDEQLVAGGEDSSRPEAAVELSDAERRVAALAAQGHTNRQIARKLYISVSTVEQHLTKVYRKLKVNRRTDLPLRGL